MITQQTTHINKLKDALTQFHVHQMAAKRKEKELQDTVKALQQQKEMQQRELEQAIQAVEKSQQLADTVSTTSTLAGAVEAGADADTTAAIAPVVINTDGNANAEEFEMQEEGLIPAIPVDWSVAQHWLLNLQKRECLVNLMLDKQNGWGFIRYLLVCLILMQRLLEKIFISGPEAEQCVGNLINIFVQQGKEMDLIFRMIELECSTVTTYFQLFRGEEFPARCIRVFTRLV